MPTTARPVQTVFGLTLPAAAEPLPAPLARTLAQRLAAAATSVNADTPAARAATIRREAEQYFAARRTGALRVAGAMRARCDEAARTILQRTLHAPPLPTLGGEPLVA